MQKAPVAVHHRSACSGVKALRNTSDARRQAAKLCYRFGPLTPSARSANLIAGDGTKNGLSRSEQKTVSTTQNNRLTGKAPYRFESSSLQWGVRCEPDFGHRERRTRSADRYLLIVTVPAGDHRRPWSRSGLTSEHLLPPGLRGSQQAGAVISTCGRPRRQGPGNPSPRNSGQARCAGIFGTGTQRWSKPVGCD